MPHASFATEQSHTSHWLGRRIDFDLIRRLCEACCDLLKASELGTERGSSRRSNGRRTLNIELRKALPQVADLEVILDPMPEDEVDTVEGKELRGLLSEVCQFIEGIPLRFGLDQNRGCGEDENLEAILARLRGSTTYLSEVISNHQLSSTIFAYDSGTVIFHAVNVVKDFNRYLHDLKHPVFDRYELIDEPPTNLARTSAGEEPSKPQTQKIYRTDGKCERCFKHAQAAIKAMFLRLSACRYREAMVHHMLVQLPMVEDITSRHDCSNTFSLEMFLSDCPESSQWQEAQITRTTTGSQIETLGSDMSICEAIKEALNFDGGLQFHIQEQLTDVAENDFIVPLYSYSKPQHDQLKPAKSIWDLLKAGDLDWVVSARRLRSSTNMKAPFITSSERRSLAIQIVFGIVLCFRYDSNLATWDPKRVYLLAPADGTRNLNVPPYVSCVESDAKASYLDLPNPDTILQETNPSPSRTFTQIAKALLEIGFGECLDEHDAGTSDNIQQLWKHLWQMVQNFNRYGLKRKDGVDSLDKLPYIAAAELCLQFVPLYRSEVNRLKGAGSEDVDVWEIVEKFVSGHIISKLLNKGSTEPVIRRTKTIRQIRSHTRAPPAAERHPDACQSAFGRGIVAPCPGQQEIVTLFHNSTGISKDLNVVEFAETFFSRLKDFHKSFQLFLDRHGEPPDKPIRIAILDTGINKDHVQIDFDGKHMKNEWCVSFVGNDYDFHDDDGHGTHCASLIRKVAPDAEICILKVFSHSEVDLQQAQNVSKAIRHAVEIWNVDVISMSFGLQGPSSDADMPKWRKIRSEIATEIDSAGSRLFFAAASNEGKNQPRAFPSNHRSVFCVHASDGNGNDCGINPPHEEAQNNIMILGTGISLYDERVDNWVYKEGTSFATAIAAGLAASILDLTSRVPTARLSGRSKAMLRTNAGMQVLFRHMSGPEWREPRPFIVPWNFWVPKYWTVDPRGLDGVWSQLDSDFNEADDQVYAKRLRIE